MLSYSLSVNAYYHTHLSVSVYYLLTSV
uniref:Uncharacterized protein n=1 Tax=Anguilla anguilla TaxID=7936 RepID=A0A0E9U5U6_ANGAN